MLDGDVNRILVLTVSVKLGVAVRLSGEVNPTSEMVLDRDVNVSCVYSVCVKVGMADRLSGEIKPTSEMVLNGDVNENCVYSVRYVGVGVAVRLSGVEVDPAAMVLAGVLYSS